MDFAGKAAIVTGASSGIGQSLVVKLQERGVKVVLASRNADRLERLAAEMHKRGHDNMVCPTDVTRPEEIDRLCDVTMERFGRIDILVNCAGAGYYAKVADAKMDEIRHAFELNFFGPVYTINKVYPLMAKAGGGCIVNVSSTAGFRSWPFNGYYCAAKHALNAISESMMLELQDDNIDVVLVMPGTTNTEFITNSMNVPQQVRDNPPQDMTPDDVAEQIITAIDKRKRRIVLTKKGRILNYLNRLSPPLVDRLLVRTAMSGGSGTQHDV